MAWEQVLCPGSKGLPGFRAAGKKPHACFARLSAAGKKPHLLLWPAAGMPDGPFLNSGTPLAGAVFRSTANMPPRFP